MSNYHHLLPCIAAVFCLQPPGDMPTRKSVFDVILSGCIPVLFHPLTARYMYEWHWSPEVWDQVGVHFDSFEDNQQLLGQKTDFIQRLIDMHSQQRECMYLNLSISVCHDSNDMLLFFKSASKEKASYPRTSIQAAVLPHIQRSCFAQTGGLPPIRRY